jgi:hypothetical protein
LQAEVKQLKRAPARKQDPAASAPKAAAAAVAVKPQAARTRRRATAKPRPPAPVVRPRPLAASSGKSAGKDKTAFGDAIAAMRRRVGGKPGKLKAVAAGMSKPSKQNKSASADDKTGKRKK